MADDLRVAIRLSVDGKQAVGELKSARAELAGLSTEAKRSGLSSGLKDSTVHARNLASELKSIGPAIGVAFAVGAIKSFAREVGQAAIQLQKTQATLTFATGNTVEAAKAYDFASHEAHRLGLEVASTALQYAKFTAATKGTVLVGEQVKTTFTGILEASRALGLGTGETENAIRALVQMLSKGKITAEEFRGQLGDALPGATRIAAKALGVTTEEFSRMLDEGELTLDFVGKFGAALHQEFGGTATQAAKGLAAELNRLGNAWTEMQIALGQNGGVQAAIVVLKGLAELVNGLDSSLAGITTFTELKRERANKAARYQQALQYSQERMLTKGNLVPGSASAVPQQVNVRDVFDDARLRKAQNAIEAQQKAEEAGHKKSLGRVRELATAHDNAWKERAQAENELARLQNQGLDQTEDLIAEESLAWEKLDDQRQDAIQEQQRLQERAADERMQVLQRQAEEQSRIMTAPFENAIEGIQGSFAGAFESIFSGGVDTFEDLGKTIKSVFIRLAAEIAALMVIRPILAGVAGAFGGGGGTAGAAASLFGGGGGAAGVGGGGGVLGTGMNLLSAGSSLSSIFGGPSLTSALTPAVNSFGASLGFGSSVSGIGGGVGGTGVFGTAGSTGAGSLTSASLSSVLGSAGLGAAGGGIISSLMGGNSTVGSIAGGVLGAGGAIAGTALASSAAVAGSAVAAGAAAGSVFPVIGTIIGAILGGILGGVMKTTPPRGFTIHDVGAGTLRQGGKKGFSPSSFAPLTSSIDKAITGIGKELGINTKGLKYWVGYKEGKGYRTTVTGRGDQDFEDPQDLMRTIILQELMERDRTALQKGALGRAKKEKTLKGVLRSIDRDLQFRDLREDLVKDENPVFQKLALARAERQKTLEGGIQSLQADIEFGKGWKGLVQGSAGSRDGKSRADELREEFERGNAEFSELEGRANNLGVTGLSQRPKRPVGKKGINKWEEDVRQWEARRSEEVRLANEQVQQARQNFWSGFRRQWEELLAGGGGQSSALKLNNQLNDIAAEFGVMQQQAQKLGLSMSGFDEALRGSQRGFLVDQAGGAIGAIGQNLDALGVTGLRAFRDELKLSADVAPLERAAEAMRGFDALKQQALGGDLTAVRDLPGAAQRALAIQQEVFANGPQTARFRDEVRALVDGLITRLTPSAVNFNEFSATMREVGTAQISQLQKQTDRMVEQLDLIRRALRNVAA